MASDDPLLDQMVLWTRLRPPATGVRCRSSWARDLAHSDTVASGVTTTAAERDWTGKVEATRLAPTTRYYYWFEALGRSSLVGRTKTGPSGAVERLRFAVASCSNYQGRLLNAYALIAERDDLDALLHLGDYLYEYGNGADLSQGAATSLPHGTTSPTLRWSPPPLQHGGPRGRWPLLVLPVITVRWQRVQDPFLGSAIDTSDEPGDPT